MKGEHFWKLHDQKISWKLFHSIQNQHKPQRDEETINQEKETEAGKIISLQFRD